jgi:hypothetical protein
MKSIRIGCGSASWGDMLDPVVELAERGNVQYIGFDHLAELTMSILQRMKQKDPQRGYIPDLVPWMKRLLPITREKGIRMLTNAGGANVSSAGAAVAALAKDLGHTGMKIGLVYGDDVLDRVQEFRKQGLKFANLDTGEEDIDRILDRVVSANAYIGSEGQIQALAEGADLVITGRATDSSVHIAPMVHEFGWSTDNWDLMGAAIAIGHIIECSSGCAGGMSNFWKDIKEPWRVAFPIAEVYENGDAIITKADGSGRLVTEWTVKEHLVYEVHDPAHYIMADGIADLTKCKLETVGTTVKVTASRAAASRHAQAVPRIRGRLDRRVGDQRVLARRVREGAVLREVPAGPLRVAQDADHRDARRLHRRELDPRAARDAAVEPRRAERGARARRGEDHVAARTPTRSAAR